MLGHVTIFPGPGSLKKHPLLSMFTDSLGAKIDKVKIPNGWKILSKRVISMCFVSDFPVGKFSRKCQI